MLVIVFTIMIWETDAYSPHHSVAVNLPGVRHAVNMPRAKREDACIVSIMPNFLRARTSEPVAVAQLPLKIDGRLAQSGEKRFTYRPIIAFNTPTSNRS
jgi:hypothetical protein